MPKWHFGGREKLGTSFPTLLSHSRQDYEGDFLPLVFSSLSVSILPRTFSLGSTSDGFSSLREPFKS